MGKSNKILKYFNIKYIIGEVLLLFIGITLAIAFNNWNNKTKLKKNKANAISKIEDELKTNLDELLFSRKTNTPVMDGIVAYKKKYGKSTSEVISTHQEMNALQKKYPSVFIIKDSIATNDGKFLYSGGTSINLELVELSNIAWKTGQSLNIANHYTYDCLYELEGIYSLQLKVVMGYEKLANALEENNINQLIRSYNILHQYDLQLEQDYKEMLLFIKDCK